MLGIALVTALVLFLWGAYPGSVRQQDGWRADESKMADSVRPASGVRVATFNIYGGKGRDGRRDLGRAARDLETVDIAALQEVHDSWRASRQLARLATYLHRAALNAPTRQRWFRRHRSNALLTRYPVGRWTRMRLQNHPRQRFHYRNLTVARVELARPLWVLFTHLNRNDGADAQLDQVMREFAKYSPAVLMGDFNMNRDHPAMRKYLGGSEVTDALGQTLNHDDPGRIDWILCRGVKVVDGGVIDSDASDHPLFWCDIEL